MLSQRYSRADIDRALLPHGRWHPLPDASERRAWAALPAALRRALVARGRKSAAAPWPAIPATLYLDFARTGNRTRGQAPYMQRRQLLTHMVLAECVEGRGRLADPIADAAWSLCEESAWCIPAHQYLQPSGPGLAAPGESAVDLFAGETAALLAWTLYLLAPALDSVSPQIAKRIRHEIRARILSPCMERDDFWWMGLGGARRVNNWNPWVNSNWLASVLIVEPDHRRRVDAVVRSMRSIDVFIDHYPADGGCDEGPSYWTRAGASLFDYLDLIHSATAGAIDLFREPLIREIGRFIHRAHIADRWFINFADAPAAMGPPAGLVLRYGQRIRDRDMQAFAGAFRPPAGTPPAESLPRALPDLFIPPRAWRAAGHRSPLLRDVWLPDTQVMVARSHAGSPRGLTLAAKGGHNAESHNHNDVGHFIVSADGRPVLIDVGVEAYTRKTFSAERYSIWTMQSQYHNLPTIGGVMQSPGAAFKARDIRYSAGAGDATLEMDIADAYPPAARLRSWRRRFAFRRGGDLTVEDRYEAEATPESLTISLMTPCAVRISGGTIRLGSRTLPGGRPAGSATVQFDPTALRARVERIRLADERLQAIWGAEVFRIVLAARRPGTAGSFALRVKSASARR